MRARRIVSVLFFAVLGGVLSASCGGVALGTDREDAFRFAVEASLGGDHARAAGNAFNYASQSTQDDPRYDRALLILARSLEQSGLSYAASLYYLDILQARRNVEILDDAVEGLERITLSGPHDARTIIEGFLATADITGLSPEHRAFVDFLQGRESARRGLDEWADQMFARIPPTSRYRARADYVRAIRSLGRNEIDEGKALLLELEDRAGVSEDIHAEVVLALARLHLERGEYDEAITRFEEVKALAPQRPELLLEMAWAHFYKGDSRRALGFLIALDAPIYGGLIAPERYLLEAFCLRRICQFEPARLAAARLRRRHGDALADLHGGVTPIESATIRRAARVRSPEGSASRLRGQIIWERDRMRGFASAFGSRLFQNLRTRYDNGLAEAERREREELPRDVNKVVEELLEAEDGVRLILHELSVDLLRGRQRPPGPPEAPAVDVSPGRDRASYTFNGEFWTDELDDLAVVIPDRCLE